jgi:hypothetical protein
MPPLTIHDIPLPCLVIDSRTLTITDANAFFMVNPTALINQSAASLLQPTHTNKKDSLKLLVQKGAPFQIFLNIEAPPFNKELTFFIIKGFKFTVRVKKMGSQDWLILRQTESKTLQNFMATTRDFTLTLSDDNKIIEITPNFYLLATGKVYSLINQSINTILSQQEFRAFLQHTQKGYEYFDQCERDNREKWKTVFQDAMKNKSRWLAQPQASTWKTAGKGLTLTDHRTTAYLWPKKHSALADHDILITVKVNNHGKTRYGVMFNQHPDPVWHQDGYSFGPLEMGDKVYWVLKKDSRIIAQTLDETALEDEHHLEIRATGGLIQCSVNYRLVLKHYDAAPLPTDMRTAGLLSIGTARFSDFTIQARPSLFQPDPWPR